MLAWINSDIESSIKAGAKPEDLADPAFRKAQSERWCDWWKREFAGDQDALNEMLTLFIRTGSPEDLRLTAERLRSIRRFDDAYLFKCVAADRQEGR
jgi:hypothetical protein